MARFLQPSNGSGGGVELPQDLRTVASPTFNKIYINNNGAGRNISVGDDVWIGDVNYGNFMSIQGQQDDSQGGIIFGSALNEKIWTGGGGELNFQSSDKLVFKTKTVLDHYSVLQFTGNTNDPFAQIYVDDALFIEGQAGVSLNSYNGNTTYIGSSQGQVILDGDNGEFLNSSGNPLNQIATLGDIKTMGYGAFHDETTFGPYAANSEHALSYQSTDLSYGVHIGGINNSELVMERSGVYNIQFSTQFHSSPGAAIVYVWLKKNGTSMPWTNTRFDITSNNPYAVAAWNWLIDCSEADSIEIYWSSPSNNVKVEAITGLTGTKPNVPSNIVTVTQVS